MRRCGFPASGTFLWLRRRLLVVARFDEVLATFWASGGSSVGPPLKQERVCEAEHVLGVKLPSALLVLLRVQNGGVVADGHNAFPTAEPTSWSADHVPFDVLMGTGGGERATSLLDTP